MNVVIVRVVFYNPHTAVVCLFLGLLQCFKDAYLYKYNYGRRL